MKPALRLPILALLSSALWMTACSPGSVEVVSETDEKQYQRGKLFLRNGNSEDALDAFMGVIDARRDAPESHLEAGYIFLREMKDPVRANYHFSRYLELKPQSDRAPQVRQLIETAQKEFARQLPAQPYEGELDRMDLMDLMKNMRMENESLKRDLMTAQRRVTQLEGMISDARRAPAPVANTQTRQQPVVSQPTAPSSEPESVPRTYTVQSGDSLSGISRKVYGTSSRWIDIYQANRDRLSSENALKVGQELRIP
ncbi:MAG: LysM peptidoglycan-binding domain-containing protein [Coraliomargarita sp.]|nr:LysM peptidoglycan-binding domain-containing protein [Coraliomargarita sp.]